MRAHLVLIGTGGKQRFIFSSTKRKEIVGASELITRVERDWKDEAFAEVFSGFSDGWRVEQGAELISAGAGGVTAVVQDADRARDLVTALTRRALAQAPGLDVCGVVTDDFEWGGKRELAEAIGEAHRLERAVRAGRPGPQARFARLPIVDECSASGLPAAELRTPASGETEQPRSAASAAKLDAYETALGRLAEAIGASSTEKQARDVVGGIVDYLGYEADWVAVVHADGNGLGTVFAHFDKIAKENSARGYAQALREFSSAVDNCARDALRDAVGQVANRAGKRLFGGMPTVLPLVRGGDDLTVVCDGAIALSFTRRYLELFATYAAERLGGTLGRAGYEPLGAAAGVAIVKRNYPFHFAYDLAEELMDKEAKQVKKDSPGGCALAFHVLYESSAPDLTRLRERPPAGAGSVTAQPYIVNTRSNGAPGRRWEDLARRVGALGRKDGFGERLLPSGAVHELREGLFLGPEVAEARYKQLRQRFGNDRERVSALADLWGDDQETLLDAMNAAEFFAGEELS